MRIAVIADVHANLSALDAVLATIEDEAPDLVVCLGDLVGYNAEPREVTEAVRARCDIVVAGNHDASVAKEIEALGTNGPARRAQEWTRSNLDQGALGYLAALPAIAIEDDFVAVHGCYLNPRHITGYVTSTMVGTNLEAVAGNPGWPTVALCGHTHIPLAGWLARGEVVEPPPGVDIAWPDSADAVILNPGSVGQPRDRDPRASFMVVDLARRHAGWRRVEYDIDATCRTIAEAGLPAILAERLREGR